MDGIFGIGVPEMMIILLVLFIVGGPKNSAKWAREAGRMVRKARNMWQTVMAEVESELGPDGKELVDATRELGDSLREIKGVTNPTSMMMNSAKPRPTPRKPKSTSNNGNDSASTENEYPAWLPPDSSPKP
jgi:Sec-independent protein translocase protein TatA